MSGWIITLIVIASILAYAVIGAAVAFVVNIFCPIVDDGEMVFMCSIFWPIVILLGTGYLVFCLFPTLIIEQFEDWKKSQEGRYK